MVQPEPAAVPHVRRVIDATPRREVILVVRGRQHADANCRFASKFRRAPGRLISEILVPVRDRYAQSTGTELDVTLAVTGLSLSPS